MPDAPQIVELDQGGVALDGRALAAMASNVPGHEPKVPDGYGIGLYAMERPPPHRGERHPDGDELVIVVSGAPTLVHEAAGEEDRMPLRVGQAVIVPQGVWHRFEFDEPV